MRCWIVRCLQMLVVVWAGFWTWFAVANGISDGPAAWPHVLRFVLPVLALAAVALLWPRVGGVLLILGGALAAWYFPSSGARFLLALPAVAVGAALALLGAAGQRVRRAAVQG